MKNRMIRLVAALATLGGSLAIGAGSASAIPSSCTTALYPRLADGGTGFSSSYCSRGDGYHRATILCARSAVSTYTKYGTWKRVGYTSYAVCDYGDMGMARGVQLKNF